MLLFLKPQYNCTSRTAHIDLEKALLLLAVTLLVTLLVRVRGRMGEGIK